MMLQDPQNKLSAQIAVGSVEKPIAHMQCDLEYHKKMCWSFQRAIEKEQTILEELQLEYHNDFKDKGTTYWNIGDTR